MMKSAKQVIKAGLIAGLMLVPHIVHAYEEKSWFGYTALATAAYNGDCYEINRLLDVGADINAVENYNYTPLMIAIQFFIY